MTRRLAPAIAFAVLLLGAKTGSACSICRCGDPTFNALGTQLFERGQFRLAVDLDRLEKSQGSDEGPDAEALSGSMAYETGLHSMPLAHEGEEHGGQENLLEDRLVVTLSYAPAERLEIVARLPWSTREIETGGITESANGLADPELYGLFRLWSSEWSPGIGLRSWLSLAGGVKTDWGENDMTEDGERLDEHLQSGTGSVDPFAGLSSVYLIDPRSTLYASLQGRWPGRNDFGYRYGAAVLVNLGYERKLDERFDVTIELNYRDAESDEIDADGEIDPNTGGQILYLSPRLLVNLGKSFVGRLAVQVPIAEDLDGEQEEKAVVNLGISTTF